jgi:hypothetical protein
VEPKRQLKATRAGNEILMVKLPQSILPISLPSHTVPVSAKFVFVDTTLLLLDDFDLYEREGYYHSAVQLLSSSHIILCHTQKFHRMNHHGVVLKNTYPLLLEDQRSNGVTLPQYFRNSHRVDVFAEITTWSDR